VSGETVAGQGHSGSSAWAEPVSISLVFLRVVDGGLGAGDPQSFHVLWRAVINWLQALPAVRDRRHSEGLPKSSVHALMVLCGDLP
jgi:hypothetical protein